MSPVEFLRKALDELLGRYSGLPLAQAQKSTNRGHGGPLAARRDQWRPSAARHTHARQNNAIKAACDRPPNLLKPTRGALPRTNYSYAFIKVLMEPWMYC